MQHSKEVIESHVKVAIDKFDPYVLLPGQDAPLNEYDGESRRLAEKLYVGISKEKVEEIIAEEFTRSFGSTFTKEDCSSPALEIYENLNK